MFLNIKVLFSVLRLYARITTAQKMKFPLQISLVNVTKILSFLRIWSHLLKKSVMENFIFCAVYYSHDETMQFRIRRLELKPLIVFA